MLPEEQENDGDVVMQETPESFEHPDFHSTSSDPLPSIQRLSLKRELSADEDSVSGSNDGRTRKRALQQMPEVGFRWADMTCLSRF